MVRAAGYFLGRFAMAQSSFEKVVEEARGLTPAEQERLRALLDEWIDAAEERLEQEMAAEGLISLPCPDPAAREASLKWQPVDVVGKPVSETIIEERR
jgi:hypothetical protein